MTYRVLGIDPGLTRCGVGVVDIGRGRAVTFVHVDVVRTSPELPLERRLLEIFQGITAVIDEYQPKAIAIERVFAQHNVRTVMGTAQVSGVALQLAASRGLSVGLHTPSEVKAAITGYGAADKNQVGAMVARVLRLTEVPRPADASDALALAICHGWRSGVPSNDSGRNSSGQNPLTPAQRAWRAAESATGSRLNS